MPKGTLTLPATAQGCLEKRNQLIKEIREVLNTARTENRELTGEEAQVNEEKMDDVKALKAEHDRIVKDGAGNGGNTNRERTNRLISDLSIFDAEADQPANNRVTSPTGGGRENRVNSFTDDFTNSGFTRFNWDLRDNVMNGRARQRSVDLGGRRATNDYRLWARQNIVGGERQILGPDGRPINLSTTIQTADDQRAGYFVLPEQMTGEILKTVDDDVWINQWARVTYLRNARSLGIRRRTAKANAFGWGTELSDATLNLENQLAYGKRVMSPHWLTGAFRLSRDLIAMADINIEAEVIAELMIDLREFLEDAYMTGSGVQRPLGLLTASADGISTSRDLTYGTTSTTFTFNSLINMKYKMKSKYKKNAFLVMHPDRISELAQFRTNVGGANTGEYMWQPSRVAGEPDVCCGIPVRESYFMPSATGTGAYFGLYGDFSYFRIVIGLEMEMQLLRETRAKYNENEYLFRMKLDAAPVMEEAFYRLTYGS